MIVYKSGYKYQLTQDTTQSLSDLFSTVPPFCSQFFTFTYPNIIIKAGCAWDGASGIAIDTDNFMRGSLVHDCLYRAMREGSLSIAYKDLADRELVRLCKEDGMSDFRCDYVYKGVKLFGYSSATDSEIEKVQWLPK